ncbi:MAG: DUF4397 domain-containing protein [Sandaracinaceae bacterium]|nr:DUF4397 domain-containing protein [Sandaracinaceae bacterium]
MNRARFALSTLLFFAGCDGPPIIPTPDAGGDPDAGSPETDAGPLPTVDGGTDAGPLPAALVRFLHVAPGTGIVSFHASGRLAAPDVYYRAATPYRRVAPGEAVVSAVDESGAAIAESDSATLEDGARYVAVLVDPPDGEPAITLAQETDPTTSEPLAVRVLNATDATLDVDVDGEGSEPDVPALESSAWSAWIGLREAGELRPLVAAGEAEPFSITEPVQPWVEASASALLVLAGRPSDALPSEPEGLSILLVLEATEEASPFFVLRPDPRLAILQASPDLAPAQVYAEPSSGGDRVDLARSIGHGELLEATMPPGRSYVGFVPEGELWGPQIGVDLLPGHRYLMVTRGDPGSWGDDRFGAAVVRDALEGDRFAVLHAAPDAPGLRFYEEATAGTFTPLTQIAPLAYGERTAARGVELDASRALALSREDHTEPHVWFEVPRSPGVRGFAVAAGSYFADPAARDGLAIFWVWAPARGAWTATRSAALPGSGPLPGELPPEE